MFGGRYALISNYLAKKTGGEGAVREAHRISGSHGCPDNDNRAE
jgi:hypothetical protein